MASCLNAGFGFSHLLLFFSTVAPSSHAMRNKCEIRLNFTL